jgi:hypothetical protein
MSEAAAPEEKIDRKDVTIDFLIDGTGEEEEERRTGAAGAPQVEDRGDHPAVAILDMAVKQSGEYLRKQGLPPANNAVYEHFSKPFLNTALWHYLPDGSIPDDPRVALALGVGGLALAFAPTLIALNQKKAEEEKKEREKAKEKHREETEETEEEIPIMTTFRNPVTGKEIPVGVPPHERKKEEKREETPAPDWMARLEGGGLPGM